MPTAFWHLIAARRRTLAGLGLATTVCLAFLASHRFLSTRTPGETDVTPLAPGSAIERELSTGQVHTYQLTLARGDFVRLTIEQEGIDVAAALVRPDGSEVVAVDAMDDEFRPELIVAIADVEGIYTATTRPSHDGAQGRYGIRLEAPRPAVASDQTLIHAEAAFAKGRKYRDVNDAATWPQAGRSIGRDESPDRGRGYGKLRVAAGGRCRGRAGRAAGQRDRRSAGDGAGAKGRRQYSRPPRRSRPGGAVRRAIGRDQSRDRESDSRIARPQLHRSHVPATRRP